jgi:hypothetical protein
MMDGVYRLIEYPHPDSLIKITERAEYLSRIFLVDISGDQKVSMPLDLSRVCPRGMGYR